MGIRGLSGAGGRVGNAYDTEQSAGGSSSGSAVAVGRASCRSRSAATIAARCAFRRSITARFRCAPTYGRFDIGGVFPIGFVNGVPGLIARERGTLRNRALAVAGDGWRADAAETGGLRGMRIGVLRRFDRKDPWSPAEPETRRIFGQAIALHPACGRRDRGRRRARRFQRAARTGIPQRLRAQGRCGVQHLSGRPPQLARRLQSRRIRPEWSARECIAAGASSAPPGAASGEQIAGNRRQTLRRASTGWLSTPCSTRPMAAAARAADTSTEHHLLHSQLHGMPAVAFPVGLDGGECRSGVELMGRPFDRRSPGRDDGCVRGGARTLAGAAHRRAAPISPRSTSHGRTSCACSSAGARFAPAAARTSAGWCPRSSAR